MGMTNRHVDETSIKIENQMKKRDVISRRYFSDLVFHPGNWFLFIEPECTIHWGVAWIPCCPYLLTGDSRRLRHEKIVNAVQNPMGP